MIRTKARLKKLFSSDEIITEAIFIDLIDSCYNPIYHIPIVRKLMNNFIIKNKKK